jgi:hypothetical protein
MGTDLKKAEQTAVDAAKVVIKVFDFATSILEELSKAIADSSELKLGKYDQTRLGIQDARVIKRYTKSRSYGETRFQRYIYSLFSIPHEPAISPINRYPFLLVSLVNVESRPPGIVYGLIKKIEGQEKTEKDFLEFFLLWLSEELNKICSQAKKREHTWEIERELPGRAEANRLKAQVSFQKSRLFDISSEEYLSERATNIGNWFEKMLNLKEKEGLS